MEDTVIRPVRLAVLTVLVVPLWATTLALPHASADEERSATEEALWSRLKARLHETDDRLDGVLGFSLKDLKTGATIEIRPDHPFPLASSIKLAVLYELYRQAEAGRLDLEETTRPPLPRVGGEGMLQFMGPRASMSWRDVAVLMMGLSDNAATNVLIERLGMDAINKRLDDDLELEGVRLRRRMMDLEAAAAGRENVGPPSEMRRLVEVVYTGKGLSGRFAADLRRLAMIPKESSPTARAFRSRLPAGLSIAEKGGELEGVRCLTAFVDLPDRPYSISINTTFLRRDADGEAAIQDVSTVVFETFDRLAKSSEFGRRMR